MDEGTLNDLLECSVCFDRLDTSSKVLPCQHTFCRKCLHDIVQKHKELRCPECRILVTIKVDELPPNVLLMRILEGMRNAAPKKQQRSANKGATNHANVAAAVHSVTPIHHHHPQHGTPKSNKQQISHNIVPHQPYAKAIYDFDPKEAGDLSFKRGDIIFLKKRIDTHWYQGECGGKQGLFPVSYVQIITPLPSVVPQCKALYDFQTDKHEEEGCLVFKEGDIINVIRRVDENWAEGKLDGKIGIFPLTFVELNAMARSLMKLSTNAQPGPSRVAPPTPTTEDSTPLIPTDHSRQIVQQHHQAQQQNVLFAQQNHQVLATSDSSSTISSGSSSTTTPNISSSNTSSNSSTAPSSPASPPPRAQPVHSRNLMPNTSSGHRQTQQHKEKRHSFTSNQVPGANYNKNIHRHSAEILSVEPSVVATSSTTAKRDEIKLPAPYIAIYAYKPQKADELELKKGSHYTVTERCQDGWYKGTSTRTQKCGVFPGNYVAYAGKLGGGMGDASSSSGKVSFTRSGGSKSVHSSSNAMATSTPTRQMYNILPPELPPRAISPNWHGKDSNITLGRNNCSGGAAAASSGHFVAKPAEKSKERKEKGSVGLMRRLTSMKRSKSPPPSTYSMDNPVFEDSVPSSTTPIAQTTSVHPVHVRSGSCPSQLLQMPGDQLPQQHRLFGSTSQRLKHKEPRPSVLSAHSRNVENPSGSSSLSPDIHHHRKSNSLDAGGGSNRAKTAVQTVNELFRCEIPYPPLSEYELELQKGDLIYVHKKREDGWYKGTLERNGQTGLFPASFVKPVK